MFYPEIQKVPHSIPTPTAPIAPSGSQRFSRENGKRGDRGGYWEVFWENKEKEKMGDFGVFKEKCFTKCFTHAKKR